MRSEADQVSGARSGELAFVQLEPQIRFEKESEREREGRRLRQRKKGQDNWKWEREVAEVAAIMRTLAQVSGLFSLSWRHSGCFTH